MAFLAAALPAIGSAIGLSGTAATVLSVAGTALSLIGGISDYQASKAQAKAVQQQGQYQASVQEQQAGQERAAAQRVMIERQREGRLQSSRAVALAAAGGGSASDPTVVDLVGDIESKARYNALSALYEGEERAIGLEQGADLSRYESNLEAKTIKSNARNKLMGDAATAMTGFGSLYDKYGSKSTRTAAASYGGRGAASFGTGYSFR